MECDRSPSEARSSDREEESQEDESLSETQLEPNLNDLVESNPVVPIDADVSAPQANPLDNLSRNESVHEVGHLIDMVRYCSAT